jgi:hypothetical protein
MMKPRQPSDNLAGYIGHFLDLGCHRTALRSCPKKALIFIAAEGYLANSLCQVTIFGDSFAEKGPFSINQITVFSFPAGNKPNP